MALTHAQLHILVLHAWRAKPVNIPKKVIVFCRNIGTLLVIPGVAPITTNPIQVMVVRTTCRTGNTTVTASLNICIALLTYNILLWSGCGILCAPLSGDEVHSPFLWTFSLFSSSFCFFLGSFSSGCQNKTCMASWPDSHSMHESVMHLPIRDINEPVWFPGGAVADPGGFPFMRKHCWLCS